MGVGSDQSLSYPTVPTAGPQTYLEVLEDLLGRWRLSVAHLGGKDIYKRGPRYLLLLFLYLFFKFVIYFIFFYFNFLFNFLFGFLFVFLFFFFFCFFVAVFAVCFFCFC